MIFTDRAPIERVRRLADGRIAAVAKFARSGVQTYTGAEVGRPDLARFNVYRPESEVFDEAAMASFAHKTITLGHPSGGVTIDNWKRVAAGWTEGKVVRDGDYVEIPLMLADAAAIRAYDSGEARELSGGYACELVWGDGIAPDGTRYQATQRKIRGDHIAQVPKGRAGEKARIGDHAPAGTGAHYDSAIRAEVDRQQSLHERQFAFLGSKAPKFNRDNAEAIARNKLTTPANAADRSKALAAARYQKAASLPNVLPGHVSGASLTGDAVTAAHNASMAKIRRARFTGE